jgi:hypothetical protein
LLRRANQEYGCVVDLTLSSIPPPAEPHGPLADFRRRGGGFQNRMINGGSLSPVRSGAMPGADIPSHLLHNKVRDCGTHSKRCEQQPAGR